MSGQYKLELTTEEITQLHENHHRAARGDETYVSRPVIKLFTPDAQCTWLIAELDPNDYDTMFGLCDLGMGEPEMGYVSLEEIMSARGGLGLVIEKDEHFRPDKTLEEYARIAREKGRIVT